MKLSKFRCPNGKVNRNKLLNSIKQTDFDEKDEKQAEINMEI